MDQPIIDAHGAVRAVDNGPVIGWVTRTVRPGRTGMVLSWRARHRHTQDRTYHPTRAAAAADLLAVWRLHQATLLAAANAAAQTTETTTVSRQETEMTHLFTENGHYSDPAKTLPELIGQLYGPGSYLQTDLSGGGVVYGRTVIDGHPVALESVVSYGERGVSDGPA